MAAVSLKKKSKLYTGVALAAASLPATANLSGAEQDNPAAAVPATAPLDPSKLPAAELQAYAAGKEEGLRLGRIEGALETSLPLVKDELQRLNRALSGVTDAEVRDEWTRFKQTSETKLSEIETARKKQPHETEGSQAQLSAVSQIIENLRPWRLLAKPAAPETAAARGGDSGGGGLLDIQYGNVVERDLWDEFGGHVKGMLRGAFDQLQSPKTEPGGLFPKPSPEQIDKMHDLRDSMRSGLREDAERIKAKREQEDRARLKAQEK